MSKRRPPTKRRRRRIPQLSDEQRVELALARSAAEQRAAARRERNWAALLDCIEGEHYGKPHCQRNRCDHWEAAELRRINEGRGEPRYSLPDSAYEARRLERYI